MAEAWCLRTHADWPPSLADMPLKRFPSLLVSLPSPPLQNVSLVPLTPSTPPWHPPPLPSTHTRHPAPHLPADTHHPAAPPRATSSKFTAADVLAMELPIELPTLHEGRAAHSFPPILAQLKLLCPLYDPT